MGKSRHWTHSDGSTDTDKHGKRKLAKNGKQHSRGRAEGPPGAKNEQTEVKSSVIFPRVTPFVVTAVTLAFRMYYVMDPKNWWMIHPDEVYQSMEVAHIETYGYGFQAHDFSPPEAIDDVTKYRKMELEAGMCALRSPLFPCFYVLVSWMMAWAPLNFNPFLLWRVAHVVVTSLLPLSVYLYTSRLTRSLDKGCVAAILVASSVHLNVLGTHCLLHSFLAPFSFSAMALMLGNHRGQYNGQHNKYDEQGTSPSNTSTMNGSNREEKRKQSDDENNNNDGGLQDKFKAGMSDQRLDPPECNGHKAYRSDKAKEAGNGYLQNGMNGHAVVARYETESRKRQCHFQFVVSGFTATLSAYIRPDMVLIYAGNIVFLPDVRKTMKKHFLPLSFGVLIAGIIGLIADFGFYGHAVVSPLNWLKFNVISGMSATFGQMRFGFYTEQIFGQDFGLSILTIISILLIFMLYLTKRKKRGREIKFNKTTSSVISDTYTDLNTCLTLSFKLLLLVAGLFTVYSLCGHKELRFIHDVIVLVFVCFADILVNIKLFFNSKTVSSNVVRTILALFLLGQYQSFSQASNNLQWIYQKTENVQDVNACIHFISSQNDVTGVFYDSNLHMTGGMSLLHHDVIIMSLMTGGFYEFGPSTRKNYTRNSSSKISQSSDDSSKTYGLSEAVTKSVNEFTKASNYIATQNAQSAARVIIQKPVYNYLVLRRDRRFLSFGFDEVFAAGSSRVLRRALDVDAEYRMQELLDRLTVGNNATYVLHEGDVLFHMAQYEEASIRFTRAIELNEKLLDAYMPLEICFNKMGNHRATVAVRGKCQSLFTVKECSNTQEDNEAAVIILRYICHIGSDKWPNNEQSSLVRAIEHKAWSPSFILRYV